MTRTLTLPPGGTSIELWDPVAGTVSALPSTGGKSGLILKLDLAPYTTQLLIVRQARM